MKKIIVAGAAATMLAFSGAAATAADYPVTQETDVQASGPSQADKGETTKFRLSGNAQGSEENCTGQYVFIVKKGEDVVKTAAKPGDQGAARFTFTPRRKGEYNIIAKYRRGVDDPCGKSRDYTSLQVS